MRHPGQMRRPDPERLRRQQGVHRGPMQPPRGLPQSGGRGFLLPGRRRLLGGRPVPSGPMQACGDEQLGRPIPRLLAVRRPGARPVGDQAELGRCALQPRQPGDRVGQSRRPRHGAGGVPGVRHGHRANRWHGRRPAGHRWQPPGWRAAGRLLPQGGQRPDHLAIRDGAASGVSRLRRRRPRRGRGGERRGISARP